MTVNENVVSHQSTILSYPHSTVHKLASTFSIFIDLPPCVYDTSINLPYLLQEYLEPFPLMRIYEPIQIVVFPPCTAHGCPQTFLHQWTVEYVSSHSRGSMNFPSHTARLPRKCWLHLSQWTFIPHITINQLAVYKLPLIDLTIDKPFSPYIIQQL